MTGLLHQPFSCRRGVKDMSTHLGKHHAVVAGNSGVCSLRSGGRLRHKFASTAAWYHTDRASFSSTGGAEQRDADVLEPHREQRVQRVEGKKRHRGVQPEQAWPSPGSPAHSGGDAVRIIGLGQRGISAAARLTLNKSLAGAECWMLDTDAKVLNSSQGPNCIQLPLEDDAQLTQQQLERLSGKALEPEPAAASHEGKQGLSFPSTSSGVAYLLGTAGAVPGGSKLVLQLATHLRRSGFFVLAALTLPFDFEGRRKLEEAAALVEALQDVANLVVIVPQSVLVRASAELTVTQALEIADITLEASCRAIQWAINVPEVLLASSGGMLWHGRDLRHYRRLLSPPMELFGTCPGAGHVGRGFASMPVQYVSEAGLASGLSTLAETAVVAAADSPFLDNLLPTASGVLCVLSLPERVLSHDLDMSPGALNDPEKYAIRAAVQVAASMVVDLVGKRCEEVVACAYIRSDWPHKDQAELCMEATLLVVEDPAAAEEKEEASPAGTTKVAPSTISPAATATARFGGRLSSGPILHPALIKGQQPQQQQQPTAPRQQPAAGQPQQQQLLPQSPPQGPTWTRSKTWQRQRNTVKERLPYAPAMAGQAKEPDSGNTSSSDKSKPVPTSTAATSAADVQQQQNQQQEQPSSQMGQAATAVQLLPRMADKFVDTMVAQSLDLPPSAARWRNHQRRQHDKQAARRASGHFPVAAIPWAQPGKVPAPQPGSSTVESVVAAAQDVWEEDVVPPPKDVKSRVAGMLQKERLTAELSTVRSSWENDEEEHSSSES